MQLTVHNKDRFPHAYAIKKLGGRFCAKGEEYYEEHEKELSKEYKEILETIDTRSIMLGGSKKIHMMN
jgi:hypothetical protein